MQRSARYSAERDSSQVRRQPRREAASRIELARPLPKSAFPALNAGERIYLEEWQSTVWLRDIDAVEDLAGRAWPCAVAETIIGVFKRGEKQAAWLVVGQDGQWAVADCASGDVSQPLDSLADALSVVCPVDADWKLEA